MLWIRERVDHLRHWLRRRSGFELPTWQLPVIIWDRPEGRERPTDASGSAGGSGPVVEPWAADTKDREHPEGKHPPWSDWRELNPGAPRRGVDGEQARLKAKDGIMQDGWEVFEQK